MLSINKNEERNMFEESPLYQYVSGKSDDRGAIYDILGPLYIKNRMNFLDLFPDVQEMIVGCNELMKTKTENSDLYETVQKRNHDTAIVSLRLLWGFVYNGYQTSFILRQYSQKRPELPGLTIESMIEHTFCQHDFSSDELKVWETPGFYYERCIESLQKREPVCDSITDDELWEFFSEFF